MLRVALLVFEGARAFDISVVTEVWGADRTSRGVPGFDFGYCGPARGRPVRLDSAFALTADRAYGWAVGADLLLVPGRTDLERPTPAAVLATLREAHRLRVPIAALCSGAFTLAEAGLLDGRRAITHWALAPELVRRFPAVAVDPTSLFVADGSVWTSAGVASGLDLCLHLVREAHGAEVAAAIARSLVTAPFRGGDQLQFADRPICRAAGGQELAGVLERALLELHRPLSLAELAGWANLSERTLSRRFTQTVGVTPLRWLLTQRIALARRFLEQTELSVDRIAARAGFGSAVTMRQHFARFLGVSPRDYRRAFRAG